MISTTIFIRLGKFLLLFMGFPLMSLAQNNDDLSFNIKELVEPAPDVYSLGKYGFTPVNKYLGVPEISIPLHEVKFEELSVPITLSYRMPGLRPREEASWVGLGWSLTSNSVITRSVKDQDDLFILDEYPNPPVPKGWIYMEDLGYVNPNNAYGQSDMVVPYSTELMLRDYGGDLKNKPDLEPDLFVVNLFGTTLKFVLNKYDGSENRVEATILNNRTYKINLLEATKNFEITDDKGYKYEFYKKSYTDALGLQNTYDQISGWLLTRIVSPTGKTLSFNYSPNQARVRSALNYVDQTAGVYCSDDYGSLGPSGIGNYTYYSESDEFYLSSITNTANGEQIVFNTSNREDIKSINGNSAQRLKSIKLEYRLNVYGDTFKKEIKFFTSYFNESYVGTADDYKYLRLKLDAIDVSGKLYEFKYHDPTSLPSKETRSIDFWGFYNGKNHSVLYPPFTVPTSMLSSGFCPDVINGSTNSVPGFTFNGAKREADSTYSIVGVLNKVKYPTGGWTRYGYEANHAKFDYTEKFEWENNLIFDDVWVTHTNPSTTTTHNFNIPISNTFETGSNSISQLEFIIYKTSYSPQDICSQMSSHLNDPAIELINPSNQVVFTLTFKDFMEDCGWYPGGTSTCTSNTSAIYCTSSNHFYQGTLAPGNYKVKLYGMSEPYVSLGTKAKIRLYNNQQYRDKIVGGLRVNEIVDYDYSGDMISKRIFDYKSEDGFTSGVLMDKDPSYIKYKFEGKNEDQGTGGGSDPYDFPNYVRYAIISSTPNSPFINSAQGFHNGYSQVREVFVDSLNSSNNFDKISTFYNIPNQAFYLSFRTNLANSIISEILNHQHIGGGQFSFNEMATSDMVPRTFDTQNGNLIKEEWFDNLGNVVKSIDYSYIILNSGHIAGVKHQTGWGTCSHYTTNGRAIDIYQNYIYDIELSKLASRIETEVLDGGSLIKETQYAYNSDWQTQTVSTDTQNETIVTNYYFPSDYGSPSDYTGLSALKTANIIAKPVKIEKSVNGNLVAGKAVLLNADGFPLDIYRYESTALSSTTHNPNVAIPSGYEKVRDLTYYTNTSRVKELLPYQGSPITFIWGYKSGYVVAKIEGATYDQVTALHNINQTVLDTEVDESLRIAELTSLRQSLFGSGYLISTYTYDPLIGMTSMTDPSGVEYFYNYDDNGRLISIKDLDDNEIKAFKYHLSRETE